MTDNQIAWSIALAVWLTCVFIGPGYDVANLNVVPRMGMVFSLIREHSLAIGDFAHFSPDKALSAGQFYSDKAPGLSLLAVAPVAVLAGVMKLVGLTTAPIVHGTLAPFYTLGSIVATACTTSLLTAACAGVLYRLAIRFGATPGAAVFASLAYAFGTPALGWGTVFFGHGAAGAALFTGFAFVAFAGDAARRGDPTAWRGMVAGAALGGAVVTEFTTGPATLAIAVWGLVVLRRLPGRAAIPVLGGAVGMGFLAGAVLLVYNWAAFGSALHLGYASVVGFDGMNQGFLGVSLPKPMVLAQIIAGPYRGLLPIAPVLLLVPFGYVAAGRRWPGGVTAVLLLVPASFLVINGGYFYWDGGASTGPRHITPCLPFLAFTLAPLWDILRSKALRAGVTVLLAVSVMVSIICASVTMAGANRPDQWLLPWLLRQFLNGDIHDVLVLADRFSAVLLQGPARLWTLLALPLCWAVALGAVLITRRQAGRDPRPGQGATLRT